MPRNHFKSIGYPVEDEAFLEKIVGMTITNGERHNWRNRKGASISWEPGNGTAIWVHINDKEVIECVTPVLLGTSQSEFYIKGIYTDPTCPHCSGLIVEKRENASETSIELQAAIQLADCALTTGLIRKDEFHPVGFACIAEEIGIYKNIDDFNSNSHKLSGGEMYAPESFLPAGLFAKEPGDMSSQAFFSGMVQTIERRDGLFKDPSWYYGKIKTYCMTVECAFDQEQVGQIEAGYIVQGTFWLVGIASRTWKRRGLFDRIFK